MCPTTTTDNHFIGSGVSTQLLLTNLQVNTHTYPYFSLPFLYTNAHIVLLLSPLNNTEWGLFSMGALFSLFSLL